MITCTAAGRFSENGIQTNICGLPAAWRWPNVGTLCSAHRDERVYRFGFDLEGEPIKR